MHKLLTRQLRRKYLTSNLPDEMLPLLEVISETYLDFEREKVLVERSLELVSEELNQRNAELRKKLKELEAAHKQLADSLVALDGIFNATGEAILAFNQSGELVRFNDSAGKILHLKDTENYYTSKQILWLFYKIIQDPHNLVHELKRLILDGHANIFGVIELKNKQLFEYYSTPQILDNHLVGRVWCLRNVTQIKENEALVQYQAFHDALTSLPNRMLLLDRINHSIQLSKRNQDFAGILFIDLDHFKKVNDTEGHQVGDKLLIEVSKRIKVCLREHDTLARLGGDEFVVLLDNIKSHRVASHTCQRILSELTLPYHFNNKSFYISASIGISMYPRDDTEPSELIRKADMAMYHAKQNGRCSFEFFNTSLERIAQYQLDLENKLRHAIGNNELTVFYQPQVSTTDMSISRMEALVRWYPQQGEAISPADFIPVAERSGLIDSVGEVVLRKVCAQIITWLNMGVKDFCVSVNLSAQQFSDVTLVEKISQCLTEHQISGKYLEFEITESMLLSDLEKATGVLNQLRELNISVAIDDFGTGYSSLKYLQKLPLDIIKIDRSFILELEQNPNEQSIVNAIISLAHSLNLRIVAEGVENPNVVSYLQDRHCEYIQGFYFYKPLDKQKMTDLLISGEKLSLINHR
ncbi:putative bifunctional diguanylate cyclase/phosphodiesterase [Aliikangiella maris]|uniref:EAL domain-containing protein n=2 Tax=Aliikangiella maris TaxID=3162458 RepID=A0ABV2BZC0_9GAMM